MSRLIITLTLLIAAHGSVADRVVEILRSAGYACEVHQAITEDGYNLTLHRIPPKKGLTARPEAFILIHGIFGSSADFIVSGRDRALGYKLHDAGYDVWMPNCRGNTFSKNHLWLNTQSSEFWDFSFHEIGIFDVPAIVDKVVSYTGNQKVHYTGHSQGCTVFCIMLSQLPKYNNRIASAHLLAPAVFFKYAVSPVVLFIAANLREIETFLTQTGFNELLPNTALTEVGGNLFCGPRSQLQPLCIFLLYSVVGFSGYQIDRNFFPKIFETSPAGASVKQGVHFGQLKLSAVKFRQYDYGSPKKNYERYRSASPPKYNLANVRVPVNLYAGGRDLLASPQDINHLMVQLKNSKARLTNIPNFNHIDFIYSAKAPRIIYNEIISRTRLLRSSQQFAAG